MALPNELILEVCKHLPNPDLKACRLLSKSWSHHASEYLFSKIYISPRKEGIEVFNFITQHAKFSHCVKRLEYNGTSFLPGYSKNEYMGRLFEQATAFSNLYRTDLNNTDQQYTKFIKACWETSVNSVAAMQEYSSHAFIQEGHREWKERDKYQRRIVRNGEFLQTLTCGLRKLDLLKSVEVCNEWHTWRISDHWTRSSDEGISKALSEPYFYGSPFGRAWGLSHPEPQSWMQEDSDGQGFTTGRKEF